MNDLIREIRNCTLCLPHLPHGVNPVFSASPASKIAIVGQAPGSVVHESGIPWDDKSGERLRQWLQITNDLFYDSGKIALLPMGFCYPGKGKSGDLPPRPECAPTWHSALFSIMPNLSLVILIGTYAQHYYLREKVEPNLTKTVKNFNNYLPRYFVLPHPSPRNNIWLKKNAWFEDDVLPALRSQVKSALK